MSKNMLVLFALFASASTTLAASPLEGLDSAADKATASGYSWTMTYHNPANPTIEPTVGKTDRAGLTTITMTQGRYKFVAYEQGPHVAISFASEGWKRGEDMKQYGGEGANICGQMMARLRLPLPAQLAKLLAKDVGLLSATPDGYSGAFSPAGALDIVTGGQHHPQIQYTSVSGEIRYLVKGGALTGFEYHVSGTLSNRGKVSQFSRSVTVQLTDIGSTTVGVPKEAERAFAQTTTKPVE